MASMSHAADPPSEVTVYFGTYTKGSDSKGIYSSKLNLKTGELTTPELRAEIANPSFLAIAPRARIRTQTVRYPLEVANEALDDLRSGRLQGAAVLVP